MIISDSKTNQQIEWITSISNQIKSCKMEPVSVNKSKSTAMVHTPNKVILNVPHIKGKEQVFELLDKHNKSGEKVLIIDDIDFDGTGACYIVYRYLKECYKANIEIYCNNKHGFAGDRIKSLPEKYDLIIIVDSSTNLVDTYDDIKGTDILILDHHEIQEGSAIQTTNTEGSVIVNCNSTMTQETRCISAGMHCYLLMDEYYRNNQTSKQVIGDDIWGFAEIESNTSDSESDMTDMAEEEINLFEVGAVTNISDIVPVDEFVRDILIEYYLRHGNETTFIHNLQCTPTNLISKMNLQWGIIPLINYTRRLQDESTLNLLYRDSGRLTADYLKRNHTEGKGIVSQLKLRALIVQKRNYVYADISNMLSSFGDKILRFTGLLCNQLQTKYNKPCVVSVEDEDGIKLSVRSNLIDSLAYFISQPGAVGGGHKSACGFYIDTVEHLKSILDGYDEYLDIASVTETVLTRLSSIDDIFNEDLLAVALYNELCFSNLSPIMYIVDDFSVEDLKVINSNCYLIHDIISISAEPIEEKGSLLLKPLFDPKVKGSVKLVIRSI